MPVPTPGSAFQTLLQRLEPLASEVDGAERHAGSIRSRLVTSFGGSTRLQLVGSHARGSSARGLSDVDYFAVLPVAEARVGTEYLRSGSFMEKVRTNLSQRFHQTSVSRDAQAIVLHFQGGDRPVDVVPSIFSSVENGNPLFCIPSGDGQTWIKTSPDAHNRYLRQADESSGGKLKFTSRLLKCWKAARQSPIPIMSFHSELLLASEGICQGARSYQNILNDFFNRLAARSARGLTDPLGISGVVPAASTEARRAEVVRAAEVARDRSSRAINAELAGRHAEANQHWGLVFNGEFPA